MKVLVLNCGSSSIKYKLFEMADHSVLAQGGVEKIGLPDSFLQVKLPNGENVVIEKEMPEHTVGIQLILDTLVDEKIGCIKDLKEIEAVGHRVVHGGEKFNQSVVITPEVKEMIVKCAELAPLHNPANLKGIDAIEKTLPGVPQVAVFDTAFHQTMPDYAYMYALPYELYEKYAIRRYGFHGTLPIVCMESITTTSGCNSFTQPNMRSRLVSLMIYRLSALPASRSARSFNCRSLSSPLA